MGFPVARDKIYNFYDSIHGINPAANQGKQKKHAKERQLIPGAFMEFVGNLFDVLAEITGNILADELRKLVEGKV